MSAITTHVLNTASGAPAGGIPVLLETWRGYWDLVAQTRTNPDGRASLMDDAPEGRYRLTFAMDEGAFYPEIAIQFVVRDARHHHIPLLLSGFGYTTYRGS
jgi:5-hydroxyisourate hydrolase